MSIENFYTNQSQNTASLKTGGAANVGGKGALGGNAVAQFMEFLLLRLGEQTDTANTNLPKADVKTSLQSDNPALQKDTKLDLVQLLSANPEIEAEVKDMMESTGMDLESALQAVLNLNQQGFFQVTHSDIKRELFAVKRFGWESGFVIFFASVSPTFEIPTYNPFISTNLKKATALWMFAGT